ncbi:MAG: adenosine deaminase, partial [Actinomycetota bacterium]|nr:adenosine deaminase [Actinomycetota bacterium]
LRTRAVARIEDHPFCVLREAGVTLTLNSDDPGMFDTTLNHEYEVAHHDFGLSSVELADLSRSAVRVSFRGAAGKRELLAEIDAYERARIPA